MPTKAKMPDAHEWAERIRIDYAWLKTNIHTRMWSCLALLQSPKKIRDPHKRVMAPWARRVARATGSMDFLHRLPQLDAEYMGAGEEMEDRSNDIEDAIQLLADKADVRLRLRQAQHALSWSPVGVLKVGMPLMGVNRSNTLSEATPEEVDTIDFQNPELEPVPDEIAKFLELSRQKIPPLEGGARRKIKEDILPTPETSLDIPWVDWVDPRHWITERGVNSNEMSRYNGHVTVVPLKKFLSDSLWINKDKVQRYFVNQSSTDDANAPVFAAKEYLGGNLLGSFNVPSSEEVVVLCEVWIREDPDHPDITHRVGTLDLLSETWVTEVRPNPFSIFPFVTLQASDEQPGLWNGPAYIEQAWDDIREAAWARRKFHQHVDVYSGHKWWINEELQFDKEEWDKATDPDYNGPIRYSGMGQPPAGHSPPQMPPAVIQWATYIDQQFNRNTGITGTAQGSGQSNKVATAFRQEERFFDERRDEMRFRLYEMYRRVMLIATFLVQRYSINPVEIKRGNLRFRFGRDIVMGVINYKIDIVDDVRGNPLEERMVEIQTMQRVLQIPGLLQQFDMRELARIVARINRWGNRVLAPPQEGPQPGFEQDDGGQVPGTQGGTRSLGSQVDSTQDNGQTGSAVAGAPLRGAGGGVPGR